MACKYYLGHTHGVGGCCLPNCYRVAGGHFQYLGTPPRGIGSGLAHCGEAVVPKRALSEKYYELTFTSALDYSASLQDLCSTICTGCLSMYIHGIRKGSSQAKTRLHCALDGRLRCQGFKPAAASFGGLAQRISFYRLLGPFAEVIGGGEVHRELMRVRRRVRVLTRNRR